RRLPPEARRVRAPRHPGRPRRPRGRAGAHHRRRAAARRLRPGAPRGAPLMDAVTAARRALAALDLTNLDDACDAAATTDLCRRAATLHGPVAAVCLWPRFVAQARRALEGTGIRIATVVNFPSGEEPLEQVRADTRRALDAGA